MFDPFNDFQTAGYLRNAEAQKDPKKVRRAEHVAFMVGLEQALDQLKRRKADLTYADYLQVHKTLFQDYYPWAGIDRHDLGVGKLITKGPNVQFELSENCRKAVEWGLSMGNDVKHIRERPGEVMGAFAWGLIADECCRPPCQRTCSVFGPNHARAEAQTLGRTHD